MVFTVNNQEWQLKFVNPNNKELMRSDGSITLGMTDNNVKTVYINNKLNNYMTDKVLAHELTHVFAFEFDYFIPIETEEIVADFMSLYGRDIVYLLDDLVGILKKPTLRRLILYSYFNNSFFLCSKAVYISI